MFLLNSYCVLWYFVRNDEIKLYNLKKKTGGHIIGMIVLIFLLG